MPSMKKCSIIAVLSGLALIVGGCTSTSAPPDSTANLTATVAPTITADSGTTTPSGESSGSQDPASSLPTVSLEPTVLPKTASVTLFYIAEGDGGTSGPAVGCGDSAVAVTSPAITFTDPVEGALRTLLAYRDERIGQSGLVNTLWQSRLVVDSVDRSTSALTVHLSGTLRLGGVCDNPRLEQQLLLTAAQAAGSPVAITINGKTLSEALCLK